MTRTIRALRISNIDIRHVYLAGPMTGIEDFNFPAFRAAREDLRGRGLSVFCPAEAEQSTEDHIVRNIPIGSSTFAEYMARDLPEVCRADAVVVLPGWESSRGARLEVHTAFTLGIPVLSYPDLSPVATPVGGTITVSLGGAPRESVVAEAERIINGPRRDGYGHPLDNFTNTARLWTAHLHNRRLLHRDAALEPEDVAWLMVQVKQARELNAHQRDNLTDAVGYVGTLEMIKAERRRRDTDAKGA